MAYTIVNPGAGDDYFDKGGTAITPTTQPTVGVGRAAGFIEGSTTLSGVAPNLGDQSLYGSQLASGSLTGLFTQASNAATNFGTLTEGRYIMIRGGANTEFLHGDADTTLRQPASFVRRSIHKVEMIRGPLTASGLRANQWNQVTATWNDGFPLVTNSGVGDVNGNLIFDGTADHAALPSSTIPGELVYKEPKPLPQQDNYKERFLW